MSYAPGDTLVMSRALSGLAQLVPGVAFSGTGAELLQGLGVTLAKGSGTLVRMNEAVVRANKLRRHYSAFYHEELARLSGVPLPVTDIRPVLALSEEDRGLWRPSGPYVVISPGWKRDIPIKAWPPHLWKAVVDQLRNHVEVVQVGAVSPRHENPNLPGVTSMVGKTTLRHLAWLAAGSSACVSGVSLLMHMAAAFNRPCTVLAGGREPWWWTAYTAEVFEATTGMPPPPDFVPHQFLHTIGQLPCCAQRGCFKFRLEGPAGCTDLVEMPGRRYARCLTALDPLEVSEIVLRSLRREA